MENNVIEIYKNYGIFNSEKKPAFSYGNPIGSAITWDTLKVKIPEGFSISEGNFGDIISTPWGIDYTVNELLMGSEKPYFAAYDHDLKYHRVDLEVAEE